MEEKKEILELEKDLKISESSIVPEIIYEPQYTCPNCGELLVCRLWLLEH